MQWRALSGRLGGWWRWRSWALLHLSRLQRHFWECPEHVGVRFDVCNAPLWMWCLSDAGIEAKDTSKLMLQVFWEECHSCWCLRRYFWKPTGIKYFTIDRYGWNGLQWIMKDGMERGIHRPWMNKMKMYKRLDDASWNGKKWLMMDELDENG